MRKLGLIFILIFTATSAFAQLFPEVYKSWAEKRNEEFYSRGTPEYQGEVNRVKTQFDRFWMNGDNPANANDIEELANIWGAERFGHYFTAHYYRQLALKEVNADYEILLPPYTYEVRDDGYICIDGCPEVDGGVYE